jgi:hypothetical protein
MISIHAVALVGTFVAYRVCSAALYIKPDLELLCSAPSHPGAKEHFNIFKHPLTIRNFTHHGRFLDGRSGDKSASADDEFATDTALS